MIRKVGKLLVFFSRIYAFGGWGGGGTGAHQKRCDYVIHAKLNCRKQKRCRVKDIPTLIRINLSFSISLLPWCLPIFLILSFCQLNYIWKRRVSLWALTEVSFFHQYHNLHSLTSMLIKAKPPRTLRSSGCNEWSVSLSSQIMLWFITGPMLTDTQRLSMTHWRLQEVPVSKLRVMFLNTWPWRE